MIHKSSWRRPYGDSSSLSQVNAQICKSIFFEGIINLKIKMLSFRLSIIFFLQWNTKGNLRRNVSAALFNTIKVLKTVTVSAALRNFVDEIQPFSSICLREFRVRAKKFSMQISLMFQLVLNSPHWSTTTIKKSAWRESDCASYIALLTTDPFARQI